jgi:hypothetical protein
MAMEDDSRQVKKYRYVMSGVAGVTGVTVNAVIIAFPFLD